MQMPMPYWQVLVGVNSLIRTDAARAIASNSDGAASWFNAANAHAVLASACELNSLIRTGAACAMASNSDGAAS
jgi:hypothetical protein